MFGVPKDIARKIFIKSNYVLQKTSINIYKPQFQTGQTKNSKNDKKTRKNAKFTAFPVASPLEVLEGLLNAAKSL